MMTLAEKRDVLNNRRTTILADLDRYEAQLRSRDRYLRKQARRVLEALYHEYYQVNAKLARLAAKEVARSQIANFFTRH